MSYSSNQAPLTPNEINAILGLADEADESPPQAMLPARAGEPAFELASQRDTALANALFREAKQMKRILEQANLDAVAREAALESHANFTRTLLEFLRYVDTKE